MSATLIESFSLANRFYIFFKNLVSVYFKTFWTFFDALNLSPNASWFPFFDTELWCELNRANELPSNWVPIASVCFKVEFNKSYN